MQAQGKIGSGDESRKVGNVQEGSWEEIGGERYRLMVPSLSVFPASRHTHADTHPLILKQEVFVHSLAACWKCLNTVTPQLFALPLFLDFSNHNSFFNIFLLYSLLNIIKKTTVYSSDTPYFASLYHSFISPIWPRHKQE
jgi:hypothetical protein